MSPAQTVAETKPHKGTKCQLRFFVAQNARTGHFAVTVCYAMLGLFFVIIPTIFYSLLFYKE
jgi:hypothetical protein